MLNIIILPITAGVIAQIIKFLISANKLKLNAKNLLAYSGMPSSHSAAVISLATIIGLQIGWTSPLFGFALIFAIIVIRDAIGLRRYLGQHGKILNVLVKDLKEDELLDENYPHLLEKIGHTPLQVAMGGSIGLIISIIGYLISNNKI
ncbi:hypothetical protein COT99_02055 [Candidatus Falkowbacteria bacterium CG10_big_fil_rev_8_21_14_0_10_43_10]|uniref:Acid phosphatase n=1 Tax=Candidatus Falkowbacteria bacterium CG10_big_fil_rev_8_21_14_0_10_43_10 TaxID=1974567 RepID=A0A2H0V2D5_9BACT|nr:MAG: hypothetical protein COT99_02055 [Candidatus Falkowbacteria bacterium CG10_big_fil_rev_8_21_14_0_10_43_10]